MGYGVIGNTGDSGSSVLGSSPGTPALVLGLAAGGDSEKFPPFGKVLLRCPPPSRGGQEVTAPLCSGLARRPLKAVARVRIPSGLPRRKARILSRIRAFLLTGTVRNGRPPTPRALYARPQRGNAGARGMKEVACR